MPVLAWTYADLELDARRMLQERTTGRFLEADLMRWANEGEAFIAGATRCLRSSATAATVTAEQAYAAPTSALSSWAVVRVTYDGVELEEAPWERRKAHLSKGVSITAASGTPVMWSPYGQQIILTPPPDAAKTLEQWFAHLPDAITASADALQVPIVYGPAVVTYMVYKGLFLKGMHELALHMWQMFLQQLQMLGDKQMPDRAPDAADSGG